MGRLCDVDKTTYRVLTQLDGITAVLCDDAYWVNHGNATTCNGFIPKIHAGSFGANRPLKVPVTRDIVVQHFHAQNKAAWLDDLPHRTVNGAYRFNEPLAKFLADASAADVDNFYETTQVARVDLVGALARHGLLVEAELRLKDKVSALPL